MDKLRDAAQNRSRANLGSVSTTAGQFQGLGGDKRNSMDKLTKLDQLTSEFTEEERLLMINSPDPVFATAQRIQRAIITRFHAGGMHAPPPIISRIFQEISNGLLAYNNATKIKEIPVPFAYVQLTAAFLNVFALLLVPVAIAVFTDELWISLVATAMTVASYYALFIVANDLEDPYGTDANDMPTYEYHEEFCAMLCALTTHAWLPGDQWLVPSGNWVKPQAVGFAANAFLSTTGSKSCVKMDHQVLRPTPHNNLLNRQKQIHTRGGSVVGRAIDFVRRGGKVRSQPFTKVVPEQAGPAVAGASAAGSKLTCGTEESTRVAAERKGSGVAENYLKEFRRRNSEKETRELDVRDGAVRVKPED